MAPSIDERDEFIEDYRQGARRPKRGVPITDDELRRVARIYTEAQKRPKYRHRPRVAVAQAEGVSYATAARRIRMAREKGYLSD